MATRRRHWKPRYQPITKTLPRGEEGEAGAAPSVSTSYSLEPLEKYKTPTVVEGRELEAIPKTPARPASGKQQGQQDGLTPTAIACMSLLALQFGIQPILVRKFTPQTIVRSSVVLVQELVKFGIAGAIYFSGTKKETREKDFEGEIQTKFFTWTESLLGLFYTNLIPYATLH